MTNAFAIALLKQDIQNSKINISYRHNEVGIKALELAIKALEQQPCEDCISRQAVIQKINNKLNPCTDMFKCLELSEIKEDVENLPSVKPTRPKGKWIILDECANEGVYCSECHKTVFKLEFSHTMKWRNFKYCPNCGADMRGDSE